MSLAGRRPGDADRCPRSTASHAHSLAGAAARRRTRPRRSARQEACALTVQPAEPTSTLDHPALRRQPALRSAVRPAPRASRADRAADPGEPGRARQRGHDQPARRRAVEAARAVLQDLYRRLEARPGARPHEVDGARSAWSAGGGARRRAASRGDDVLIRTEQAADQRRARRPRPPICGPCSEHELVFGIGPAGTGKTYLAVAIGVSLLSQRRGRAPHPVAAGGRGRRAAGLPARRHEGQGRSLSAPAL